MEMLLFSTPDYLELLPALPSDWMDGAIQGICARGGVIIDIEWQSGKLKRAVLKADQGKQQKVFYRDQEITVDLKPGQPFELFL